MKYKGILLGLMMVLLGLRARATDVLVDANAFGANPAAGRTVTYQVLEPFPSNLFTNVTDDNGQFTISSAKVADYAMTIRASGGAAAISFQFTVTATNLGTVNASDITSQLGIQTYPVAGKSSWTIDTMEKRYQLTGTTLSNTFYPLFSNPSNYTSWVVSSNLSLALSIAYSNSLYSDYTTKLATQAALAITNIYPTNAAGASWVNGRGYVSTNYDALGAALTIGLAGTNYANGISNALYAQIGLQGVSAVTATNIATNQVYLGTNALSIASGLAAMVSTNRFDPLGAGTLAATAATNGYPWGALYDPIGAALVVQGYAIGVSNNVWATTGRAYNVLSNSVVGNGVTDDSAAIQAISANGGVLHFDPAHSYVGAGINLTNNTYIDGQGSKFILKAGVTNTPYFYVAPGVTNVVFNNVNIDGLDYSTNNPARNSSSNRIGILCALNSPRSLMFNVTAKGLDTGVKLVGDQDGLGVVRKGQTLMFGINVYSNYNGFYASSTTTDNMRTEYFAPTQLRAADNVYGVWIGGGNIALIGAVLAENWWGAVIDGTPLNPAHGTVAACLINHNNGGILVANFTSGSGELIQGNQFRATASGQSILISNAFTVTVTGNMFAGAEAVVIGQSGIPSSSKGPNTIAYNTYSGTWGNGPGFRVYDWNNFTNTITDNTSNAQHWANHSFDTSGDNDRYAWNPWWTNLASMAMDGTYFTNLPVAGISTNGSTANQVITSVGGKSVWTNGAVALGALTNAYGTNLLSGLVTGGRVYFPTNFDPAGGSNFLFALQGVQSNQFQTFKADTNAPTLYNATINGAYLNNTTNVPTAYFSFGSYIQGTVVGLTLFPVGGTAVSIPGNLSVTNNAIIKGIITGNGSGITNASTTNLMGAALIQSTNIALSLLSTSNAAYVLATNGFSTGQQASNFTTLGNIAFGPSGQATNITVGGGTNYLYFAGAGSSLTTNGALIWDATQHLYTNWLNGSVLTNNTTAWLYQTNGVTLYSIAGTSPVGTYSAVSGAAPAPNAYYTAAMNDHMVQLGYWSVSNQMQLSNNIVTNVVNITTNNFIANYQGYGTNERAYNITLLWDFGEKSLANSGLGAMLNFSSMASGQACTNLNSGYGAAVLSGATNKINFDGGAVIAGGIYNSIAGGSGNADIIVGGAYNTLIGSAGISSVDANFMGGGMSNNIGNVSLFGVLDGGFKNRLVGGYTVVSGGVANTNSSTGGIILGGSTNYLTGNWSLAGGQNTFATNDNTFVWNGSSTVFNSTKPSQVSFNATNGMILNGALTFTQGAITNGGVYFPSNTFSLYGITNGMSNFAYWMGSSNGVLVTCYYSNGVPYFKNMWP